MITPRFKTIFRLFQLLIIFVVVCVAIGLGAICVIDVDDEISAEGVTEPTDSYTMRAMADHTILHIHKRKGDHIEKGDVILEFNSRKLEDQIARLSARIREEEAGLKVKQADINILKRSPLPTYYRHASIKESEAKEELKKTESHLHRCQALYGHKAISKATLETAQVNFNISRSRLSRAQKISQTVDDGLGDSVVAKAESEYRLMAVKVENMAHQLKRLLSHRADYKLIAPNSGKLLRVPYEAGLFVPKGTAIAEIVTAGPKKIKAYVDEREIYKVQEGQNVRFSSEQYNVYEFGYFKGTITSIDDSAVDYKGRACFPVELLITEEPHELKLGASVNIAIIADRRPMVDMLLGFKVIN
jgi:multidrug resistance efflux pump